MNTVLSVVCVCVAAIFIAQAQVNDGGDITYIAEECAENLTKPAADFLDNIARNDTVAISADVNTEEGEMFYTCLVMRLNFTNQEGELNYDYVRELVQTATGNSTAGNQAVEAVRAINDDARANPAVKNIEGSVQALNYVVQTIATDAETGNVSLFGKLGR